MKQTAVEFLGHELNVKLFYDISPELWEQVNEIFKQAKEIQDENLLEMLHKFGFDYTYNYKGEKTIYEWIPEWFEEYKRLEQFKNK
jgi:hypothetical protein